MHKCFYIICPTDYLEYKINKKFKYQNYFYTSLGNSFINDNRKMNELKDFIKKHNIKAIYFVISMDNKIVLDALGSNEFSNISGLNNFYKEIRRQKKRSKISFKEDDFQFAMLSYYLNKKIKELELELSSLSDFSIKIGAKIYNKNLDVFTSIYSDLVCLEEYHLN